MLASSQDSMGDTEDTPLLTLARNHKHDLLESHGRSDEGIDCDMDIRQCVRLVVMLADDAAGEYGDAAESGRPITRHLT
jgi:hypothetical protein